MSTFTSTLPVRPAYRGGPDAVLVPAKSQKQQGFFARLYARLIEARRQQAMLELYRHGWRMPSELEQAGYAINERNEDALPFVR